MIKTESPSRARLALRPAALFDGVTARARINPTVVVEGERILGVEDGPIDLPDSVTTVDLPGCTLLPGSAAVTQPSSSARCTPKCSAAERS